MTLTTLVKSAFAFAPAIQTDNVWSVLNELCDRSQTNLVRFDYAGAAIAAGTAAARAADGSTKDSETVFHARTFQVRCASKANNVYLYTNRAMRTENEDGAFDHRSYRIASPEEINIPILLVNRNFKKGWETIDLRNLSVFPLVEEEADRNRLGELLHLRADLENVKDFLTKTKARLMKKHSARLKKGEVARNAEGLTVRYVGPSGTTSRIVDDKGQPVKTEKFVRTDGMTLVPESGSVEFSELPEINEDFNELPSLFLFLQNVSETLSALNAVIRPYELGICEHSNSSIVILDGNVFEIIAFEYSDYDYSPETRALLKAGVYQMADVPVSRGQNILEGVNTE